MPFGNGEFLHFPVDGSDRWTWTLDGTIASKPDQMVRQMQPTPVAPWKACEAGKPFSSVTPEPTLQSPIAHRAGACEVREGDAIGQMWLEDTVALDRQRRSERRMCHRGALRA